MRMFGIRSARPHRWRRLTVTAALAGGVLAAGGLLALPASAHVKVSGTDAVQGGFGVITFRVPSESATASTTGLLITFNAATPFTSVDTQPKAGWTATITKKPLAHPMKDDDGNVISDYIASVDFKSQTRAAAIPPGEFDLFNLSVGSFPKSPSMSFAALQAYSDGSTVNWDEQSANGAEPDHPSPVLQLSPAATAASATGASAAQPTVTVSAQPQAGSSSSGGGTSWTGIVGLIAGLLALVVSLAVLAASRSRGKATPAA